MKSKKLLKNSKSRKHQYRKYKFSGGGQYNDVQIKLTNGIFEINSNILNNVIKELGKLSEELSNNSTEIKKIVMSPIMVHFEADIKQNLYQTMFDALENNTIVKEIDFNSNKFGDEICQKLAKLLEKNASITSINLNYNNITDVGAEALTDALETNTTLETIMNLEFGNTISKDNIEKIKSILSSKANILSLFIPKNPLVATSSLDIKTKENIAFIQKQINGETSNNNYFQSKMQQLFTSEGYFYDLIKKNYDAGMTNYDTLKKMDPNSAKIVVDLHGVIQSKFFKLPENVNVVFMSPVSYISCPTGDLVEYLNENDNLNNFLDNPSCFNKNKANEKFNQSVIFYGGQYCIDLLMGRGNPGSQGLAGKEKTTGINIYNNIKGKFIVKSKNPLAPSLEEENAFKNLGIPDIPNLSYDKFPSSLENGIVHLSNMKPGDENAFLSNFLPYFFSNEENENKQFTIFFSSCREMDNQNNKENLSFYEKIIKHLNFKIQFDKKQSQSKNKDKDNIVTVYDKCFRSSTIFSNKTTMSHGQKKKTKEQLKMNKLNTKTKSKSRVKPTINNDSIIELSQYNIYTNNELKLLYNGKTQITLKDLKEYIKPKTQENIFELLFIVLSLCFKDLFFEYDENYFDYRILDFIELTKFILNNDYLLIFKFIIYFANALKMNNKNYLELINLFISQTPQLTKESIEKTLTENKIDKTIIDKLDIFQKEKVIEKVIEKVETVKAAPISLVANHRPLLKVVPPPPKRQLATVKTVTPSAHENANFERKAKLNKIAEVSKIKREREAKEAAARQEKEVAVRQAKEALDRQTKRNLELTTRRNSTKRIPPLVNREIKPTHLKPNNPHSTKPLSKIQQMIADAEARNRK
jgi:hypothetical protein